MGYKRRIRKQREAQVKVKKGVDRPLERAADKILKTDRLKRKAIQKKLRYAQNTSEKRMVAKYHPTETMKKVRAERLGKGLLSDLAAEAKPKLRPLMKNYWHSISRDEQAALTARKEAKRIGHEAGVNIAKARKLREKRKPISELARNTNSIAKRKMQDITEARRAAVKEARKLSARKFRNETGLKKRTAVRDRRIADSLEKKGKVDQYLTRKNPTSSKTVYNERQQIRMYQAGSKDYARQSGGLRTAEIRNAESAIGKIAKGRAYKSAARLGGALSIAAMFASHLVGNKEKRRG
jgi:hypothetical protein